MIRARVISYLENLPRFASEPGIAREKTLLSYLGNPEVDFPVIHIAGTNGKGSVGAFLSEVLIQSGLQVGFYTSPHLTDYPERIRVQGAEISWADFDRAISQIKEAIAKNKKETPQEFTEFDILTAVGLLTFSQANVDVAIIETGLGGTFDSTNVVDPILSIITNIGEDHLDRCGPSLEDLTKHKVGILKPGVPVISAVKEGALREIIRDHAVEMGCSLYFAEEHWSWDGYADIAKKEEVLNFYPSSELGDSLKGRYRLGLLGKYQLENAALSLAALSLLQIKWPQIVNFVFDGMRLAKWPGRFEIFSGKPIFIVDGAHNLPGARSLREALDEWFPGHKIQFVTGFLAEKDVGEFLDALHHPDDQWIGVSPDSNRAMSLADLESLISRYQGKLFETLEEALEKSRKNLSSFVWVICGSLYLVGPARQWLLERGASDDQPIDTPNQD